MSKEGISTRKFWIITDPGRLMSGWRGGEGGCKESWWLGKGGGGVTAYNTYSGDRYTLHFKVSEIKLLKKKLL